MKRVLQVAAVALLGAGVSSCSEHPLYANDARLTIQLTPENAVLSSIGQARQLTVTAHDLAGREARPPLMVWESGNPEIATVDQQGRVTAVRDGTVEITVRAGDAGHAVAKVYVEATVRSTAWISSVANVDRKPSNDRDSTSVVLQARSAR